MRGKNLIGQRFGRLTVIELIPKELRPASTANRGNHWLCRCDCGNTVIHYTGHLCSGDIQSCGCLQKDKVKAKGKNELGNKYGKLTVVALDPNPNFTHHLKWICECECGNLISVSGNNLRNGHTTSCGCAKWNNKPIEPGDRFGKLTVLMKAGKTDDGHQYWACKCDCGSIVKVLASNLRKGNSKSCGCVRSWGEQEIAKYLSQHNIRFAKEYSFNDLKLTNPLHFDFALLDKNNNPICLIEYQGIQHYQTNNKYYNTNIVQSDKLKKEYCQLHNIPLYEIKYNENTIEKLKQIVNNCGKYERAF